MHAMLVHRHNEGYHGQKSVIDNQLSAKSHCGLPVILKTIVVGIEYQSTKIYFMHAVG